MTPLTTFQRRFAAILVLGYLLSTQASLSPAQQPITAPIPSLLVPLELDSGVIQNTGTRPAIIFSRTVTVRRALWLRLHFDEVLLAGDPGAGTGSYLEITSAADGATQIMNATHIAQWGNTSAYFNGDAVQIALTAFPKTGPNRIVITETTAGTLDGRARRSICGPTDDRLLSDGPAIGRLVPIGCTGWLITDCNRCFLTAGHCLVDGTQGAVMEFNVPPSNPDGSVNHPPPEDQYAVDPSSIQSNGGQGIGDDWAYFGCFPNSTTGLTPFEAQGSAFDLLPPPPAAGQTIRITGFGTTDPPVPDTWNQVQKTHTGPYDSFSGTAVSYVVDTTDGNSGSPIIYEDTGQAIGIHTHGGCDSDGVNSGTGNNHSGLQNALTNPQGVCALATLANGSVAPSSGTDRTVFTFEITYTDPTGQAPSTHSVQIKPTTGSWTIYPMQHVSGSIETGAVYQYATQLPAGSYFHRFHFVAADGTNLPYWPDANGSAGPTVSWPEQLQLTCGPNDPNAFAPGDNPVLWCEVRDPNGNLIDAESDCLPVYISPPGGQSPWVFLCRVSQGRYEYNGTNWAFGCDCYTFRIMADHPDYASATCTLYFHPCPCPDFERIDIDPMTVSPDTIVPGGYVQIDHCINLDACETIWIKDPNGAVVRTLLAGVQRDAGCWSDYWNGRDDANQPVPVGDYTVEIESLHLDPPPHSMLRFGITGGGTGEVLGVRGLANHSNEVYVLTRNYSSEPKIVTFDTEGNYVRECSLPFGSGSNQASPYVQGISTDPEGRLYILDEQPDFRITVWDTACGCICEAWHGGPWTRPAQYWFAPIAYDAYSDRILTWARDPSLTDDKVYAFDAPCGPQDCVLDPNPNENQALWASGLAVDGYGEVWVSTAAGFYVFKPCGPLDRHYPDASNTRISIRYGRLLYMIHGGLIQIYDLRFNNCGQDYCIQSPYLEERFICTPDGPYIYASGGPCPSSDEFQCVRIQDHSSAAARAEPISVVRGLLTVVEPHAAECLLAGCEKLVEWATCGTVDNVTLRLYNGPDEVPGLSPLEPNIPNIGEYAWYVDPNLPAASSYRIRVEDVLDPNIYDWSDPFGVTDCIGDLDCDNDVDLSDLAQLLSNYGTTSGATYADGDVHPPPCGDGDVDLADLAELLAQYREGCP